MKFSTLVWIVAAVVLYAIYASPRPSPPEPAIKAEPVQPPPPPPPPKPPSCKENWHLCRDNGELANTSSDEYIRGKVECQMAADKLSKYGSPSWPWLAFGSYMPGESIKSGRMTLVENDVTFKNQFNADVHVKVVCKYNFYTKTVQNVDVVE